jgi:hypothetical protein
MTDAPRHDMFAFLFSRIIGKPVWCTPFVRTEHEGEPCFASDVYADHKKVTVRVRVSSWEDAKIDIRGTFRVLNELFMALIWRLERGEFVHPDALPLEAQRIFGLLPQESA